MPNTNQYTSYFTVVIANNSSPIGYHPVTENGRFDKIEEVKQHKQFLEQTYPNREFIVIKNTFAKIGGDDDRS